MYLHRTNSMIKAQLKIKHNKYMKKKERERETKICVLHS